jgi:hypothetical protein
VSPEISTQVCNVFFLMVDTGRSSGDSPATVANGWFGSVSLESRISAMRLYKTATGKNFSAGNAANLNSV